MARDWRSAVAGMTQVQRLVHLAMRRTLDDEERIRAELLRQRRAFYEDELSDQAARVGCPGRRGRLGEGPILSELNEMSKADAASIVNTYNYDLAAAVLRIYAEVKTANRWVYARRLEAWESKRGAWKDPQIAQYTEMSARSLAQQHFHRFNATIGYATLEPKAAVCPVCQGWVARGEVPLRVAQEHPPPYHTNCFPPDALVNLPDGSEKRIDQVQAGEAVATRRGSCQVVRVFQRRTREVLYRVSVGDRVLRLTGDHPVLTERGWLPARELQVGDRVALVNSRGDDPDGRKRIP